MWIKIVTLSLLVMCPSWVWAACSGSGLTWTCTAGSTVANVNSAISSASAGATITFDAGAYTWGSAINLSGTKGMTFICASQGACTVSAASMKFSLEGGWSGTQTNLYRISGFVFNGINGAWMRIYTSSGVTGVLTQLRIDHNQFNLSGADIDVISFGEGSAPPVSYTTVYGVIDNNTITNTANNTRFVVYAGPGAWSENKIGTGDNLFIETNTFNFASQTNFGLALVDGRDGFGSVIRYNIVRNGRIETHGYYGSFTGTPNFEVYNNQITFDAGVTTNGYRAIQHQGSGEWIVFNNTVTANTPYSSSGIVMQNYRSSSDAHYGTGQCNGSDSEDGNRTPLATYYGYPCNKQLGRTSTGILKPQYFWNNKWNSGASITPAVDGTGGTDYVSYHLHANRDYYVGGVTAQTSATSPFDGTSGMGFGTLVNRPTTCTPTPEALDAGYGGVGYFATDVGTHGTLYNCSSTNTWSTYYTPYTYPHPLRGESVQVPTLQGVTIQGGTIR